jgi:lysozyme
MRAVIALVVIALVTGVFGMSQISQAVMSKTELLKTRLVNQMGSELDYIKTRIKREEGYKLLPYTLEYETDRGKVVKENFQTGGYGHQIKKGETHAHFTYTRDYWERVFEKDFEIAYNGALKLLGDNINPVAVGIVTEMVYQMGYEGVSKFQETLRLINNENYYAASDEMLDSNWAHQTPERALRLSKIMRNI